MVRSNLSLQIGWKPSYLIAWFLTYVLPLFSPISGFQLASLPPEILVQVLSQSSSFLVVTLWKCGDSRVNRKLASNVTSVDLKDERWWTTSRYPKMLSKLPKLRSLTIRRASGPLLPVEELETELKKLPSELQQLTIFATGLDRMLLFEATNDGISINERMRNWLELPTTAQVEHYFPTLASLSTSNCVRPYPPALKEINLDNTNFDSYTFQYLPHTIEAIHSVVWIPEPSNINAWSSLPPGVHTIGILDLGAFITDYSAFPANLRECRDFSLENATAQTLETVPPHLSTLGLWYHSGCTIPCSSWAAIPRTLTSLSVSFDTLETLGSEVVAALPRTLIFLNASAGFDWADIEAGLSRNANLWPSTLKSMKTIGEAGAFHLFPPSLVELKLSTYNRGPVGDFSPLPSGLLKLVLSASSSLDEDQEFTFPARLTKLKVRANAPLSKASISRLPSNLTYLSLSLQESVKDMLELGDPTMALLLPPGLTTLLIDGWAWSWLPALPRSLTRLSISEMTSYKDEMLAQELDLFSTLPTSLTDLSMSSSEELPTLSPRSFSSLTNLRNLSVRGLGYIDSAVLGVLSKRLVSLKMTLETLPASSCAFLPNMPNLEVLELGPRVDYHTLHAVMNWPDGAEHPNPKINSRRQAAKDRVNMYPDPRVLISI